MTKPQRHSTVQFNPSEWLARTARMPRLVRSVFFDLCVYTWERAAPVPASDLFLMASDLPDGQGEAIIENLVQGGHLKRYPDGSVCSSWALEAAERAYALWEAKSRGGRGGGEAEKVIRAHVESENAKLEEPERDLREEMMDCYQFGTVPEPDVKDWTAENVASAWNSVAAGHGLKQIKKMTSERINRLNARIAEHGAYAICVAIERMADNELVLATKPTFDSILNPDTCAKMIGEATNEAGCG